MYIIIIKYILVGQ